MSYSKLFQLFLFLLRAKYSFSYNSLAGRFTKHFAADENYILFQYLNIKMYNFSIAEFNNKDIL